MLMILFPDESIWSILTKDLPKLKTEMTYLIQQQKGK